MAAHVLSCVALHTGDPAGLSAARRAAIQMQQVREGRARPLAAWMLFRLDAAQGNPSHSQSVDIGLLDPLIKGVPNVSSPRRYVDQPELVRVLLAAGRRDDAVAVAGRLAAAAADQPDFPLLRAASSHANSVVDNDFSLADRAVAGYDSCPEPLLIASGLEDAGALRPQTLRAEAVDRLEAALGIYTEVGAHRDAARVRSLLRQRGVRRIAATSAPSSRWPELSESELAVVRLVATGATNREVGEQLYLSPHTVNAHLRQIFVKLGVRSRVELAQLTAQRDPR
jgi:DNA-binding CsgD family transcriptional regulator